MMLDRLTRMSPTDWQHIVSAPPTERWALCLSGGAAYGAVQVLVILALIDELGPPTAVFGTSVGSVNGALVASDRAHELIGTWMSILSSGWFQKPNLDFWNGLMSMAPLVRELRERRALVHLKRRFYVGAVDIAAERHQLININDLDYDDRIDAVISSSSQPFIHEHVQVMGRYHFDGGVEHVIPPVDDPKLYDSIHAICCTPPTRRARRRKRPQSEVAQAWEQAGVAFDLLLSRVVRDDVRRLRRYSGVTPTTLYAPESWDDLGQSFDASPGIIKQRLFEVGPAMWESRKRLEGPLWLDADEMQKLRAALTARGLPSLELLLA